MWALLLAKPKLLLIPIVLALVIWAGAWYGNQREAAGRQAGQAAQLQIDQTQFKQVTQQYQATLQAAQTKIDADDAQLKQLSVQLTSLSAQFASLTSQRQQQQSQVSTLPDAAVQGDLEAKLGGPLSQTATLRKDDAIVTDYPLVEQQLTVQSSKVENLTSQVTTLNSVVTTVTLQRDTAIAYGNTVTGYYVKAYNAAQKHHSLFIKIITFGLVRDKHLDLPPPTTLKP